VVEQPAVNRLVAGSNPARGANSFNNLAKQSLRFGSEFGTLFGTQESASTGWSLALQTGWSLIAEKKTFQ
jgi:hypothetical protein